MKWNDKAKCQERAWKRFAGYCITTGDGARKKAPWHIGFAGDVDLDLLDAKIAALQTYSGCVEIINPIEWSSKMKQKEHEVWMSQLGVWLLKQLNLAPGVYQALSSLILSVRGVINKVQYKSRLPGMHLRACQAVTRCELRLPLMFCTIGLHRSVHWFDAEDGLVVETGPSGMTATYTSEADAGTSVKLIKSSKNREESMIRAIAEREQVELDRAANPNDYAVAIARVERAHTLVQLTPTGFRHISWPTLSSKALMANGPRNTSHTMNKCS
jgi:hypothetical protein